MSARALPILMYHHVCPAPGLVTISPQNFAQQMAWLARSGYHTASCADLEGFLRGGELPRRTVMLTFDDGYLDNYVHAYPILRHHGLHAVLFAVTDWIGNGEPRAVAGEAEAPQLPNHRECTELIRSDNPDAAVMRWSEVERTLAEGVFEFQSHTASHTRWDKISANADEKSASLAQDLERSRQTLSQRTGLTGTHLCWPQGYFDADYQAVARKQGFDYLYTTRPGTLCPDGNAASLPRIVVKDRGATWLASRLRLYGSPLLARWYGLIKGKLKAMGTHFREVLLRAALRIIHARDRRQPDPTRLGTPAIQRILAISSTAIGDTLLSTPALRSLRQGYPHAQISLLVNQQYIPLFSSNPDIDEIIPYAGGYRRFFQLARALNRRRFDVALILHGNEPQATPLAYLSGADFRFKLPNDNDFRFLLSNADPVQRWSDFPHGIDQRLAVAQLAGGAPTDHKMTMPVKPAALSALSLRLELQGVPPQVELIGFQAGASTVSRRWSAERFVELGKRLLNTRPQAWIVLTGSPRERALAETIHTGIDSPRVWNAAGELPIDVLPALMSKLRLLLTGDTGPMHLAIAVGTPVVALFAVSDWRRSGPSASAGLNRHIVIQKWRTCNPCFSKRCPYAEPPCMANISVDEVERAIVASLNGQPGYANEARHPGEKA